MADSIFTVAEALDILGVLSPLSLFLSPSLLLLTLPRPRVFCISFLLARFYFPRVLFLSSFSLSPPWYLGVDL